MSDDHTRPRRATAARGFGWVLWPLLLLAFLATLEPGRLRADDSAVLFLYHRFGEDSYPATNIRLAEFEAHLAELREGGYAVLPVPVIVAALREGRALPARTVGLTIDDAYLSVYTEAWPRLRAAGLPFTLFVATAPADAGYQGYMSWDEIRELAAAGVTIGHHTVSHAHMTPMTPAAAAAEIEQASARFLAELGVVPTLFAYPYGEYGLALRDQVAGAGFHAAFGQQSSVAHVGADIFALPRFPLNEAYGDIARFRLAANALPRPVREVTPADMLLGANNPPVFGFTLADWVAHTEALVCYAASQGKVRIERLGNRRIEVRFDRPFPPGRARVNCTLPGPDGRWRWFGSQFYIPAGP